MTSVAFTGISADLIDGLLNASIEEVRGLDRSTPVTFENMFNQVHPPSQVIAK